MSTTDLSWFWLMLDKRISFFLWNNIKKEQMQGVVSSCVV